MKQCMCCGCKMEVILITLLDGAAQRVMCPNCIAASVSNNTLQFVPDYNLVDDITGVPGAVQFTSGHEQYTLAPRAMLRLLAHDLKPHEWKALCDKYDCHNYMLHDDFYTVDGEAWQPTVHIPTFEWRDIVKVNGKCYAECFEISGDMDGPDAYQIDDFYSAIAHKYGVDVDDIETYVMDDIEFDPDAMPYGAESCGCYIDGIPEWYSD